MMWDRIENITTTLFVVVFIFVPLLASFISRTAEGSSLNMNQVFAVHKDYALVGHVIKTTRSDEFVCGLQCARDEKCQSYNCRLGSNLGNQTCQLNDQTQHSTPQDYKRRPGFTYFGKVSDGRGFNSASRPGRSCRHIIEITHALSDGEYWIDPENNGNPFKAFCDMTSDGGGWLLVANFVMNSSAPPPHWSPEPTYRGVSNYTNNRMAIRTSSMNQLRKHVSFTQLRFHCSKQQGRTFHVTTAPNSTGEVVVQYFSGQTDVMPDSCHSFVRMADDNSRLNSQCERWGYDTVEFVGKWGDSNRKGEYRMYDHPAFVPGSHHLVIGSNGKWECDDVNIGVSPNDFWKIYVR